MIKTYKELNEIDSIVNDLYRADDKLENTKFGYGYKRFVEKNLIPMIKELREELGHIAVDNALEDEKTKAVLRDTEDPRGFKFSREGLKKCIEQEKKLVGEWNEKKVTVIPYIVNTKDLPKLTEEQTEAFLGCLIEDDKKPTTKKK